MVMSQDAAWERISPMTRFSRREAAILLSVRFLDRAQSRLPQPWRTIVDWTATIAFAAAFVLAFEAEVAKPFRIPSASMEPTLHCARPADGCLSGFSDRVLVDRLTYRFREPRRGDIVVFNVPDLARERCSAGGVFVKRLIGLPGEVLEERRGFVYINGKRLNEPYIRPERRDFVNFHALKIDAGTYFMMGDNRANSCDSRVWLTVPRANIIGKVFAVYWPPRRLATR
jgi:signal peptidase I